MKPYFARIQFKLEADPINMHCKMTTIDTIHFISKINEVLGFEKKYYPRGEHTSERVINIMPINKIHLNATR